MTPELAPSQTTDLDELHGIAAERIQNAWKKRQKTVFNADSRWADAAIHAKLQTSRIAAEEGRNDPKSRWRRAAFLAARLQDDNKPIKSHSDKYTTLNRMSKALETQHWLELTDSKHRYGSNLKVVYQKSFYHQAWLESDTTDNFFKWLDRGNGRDLSHPKCPRNKLEAERIVYLSAEQRMNYLVEIDERGLLHWARNHDFVDTSPGKWKDPGDGSGIVARVSEDSTGTKTRIEHRTSFLVSPSMPTRSSSPDQDQSSQHTPGAVMHKASRSSLRAITRWLRRVSITNLLRTRLLRSMVNRETWIYVADKHYNIYVGIKDTGSFQHSSFLAGGLVASAGLISVHEGLIHKLSPLSGHYRTKIENFQEFIHVLEEKGVDTRRVEVLRAEASLWGIQQINRGKQFKKSQKRRVKPPSSWLSSHRHVSKKDNHRADGRGVRDDIGQWKKDILLGRNRLAESVARAVKEDGGELGSGHTHT